MPWLLIALAAGLPSPPEQEPARQEIQDVTRDVLSSRDYNPRQVSPTLAQRAWERLKRLFDSIGRVWEVPGLGWLLTGGLAAILLAILGHVALIFYRATRVRKKDVIAMAKTARGDPGKLLEEARKAAAGGDLVAALTLYVRASLEGLDRRGIVRLTETSTVREVRGMLHARPTEAKLVDQLLVIYEPGVFGRKPVTGEAMQGCDAAARRLALE